MKPSRPSRRKAGASLLASAILLAFLGWRATSFTPKLPALFNVRGIRSGLTRPLERRVQRVIAQAPIAKKTGSAEIAAVLAMVQRNVEEHGVVIADLGQGSTGRQLATLVAMLAFPRFVHPARLTEKERERCRGLAGERGLYALVRADASHSALPSTATRIAKTKDHELWSLEDRGR